MRQINLPLDRLIHTEGARWHDGRLWFSDLHPERICSINEDGSDLRPEMAAQHCLSRIGWFPDGRTLFLCATPAEFTPQIRRNNPLSQVLSTRVDVPVAV